MEMAAHVIKRFTGILEAVNEEHNTIVEIWQTGNKKLEEDKRGLESTCQRLQRDVSDYVQDMTFSQERIDRLENDAQLAIERHSAEVVSYKAKQEAAEEKNTKIVEKVSKGQSDLEAAKVTIRDLES